MRRGLRPIALTLLTVLAACGGSGGGGSNESPVVVVLGDATLQGTYFAVLHVGRDTGGVRAATSTGPFTASGSGLASHTQTTNLLGTVSGPTTSAYEYGVGADGALELRVAGMPIARGGVSADGDCALAAIILPGGAPGLYVLRRRSGFHMPSSLSGAYYFVLFQTATLGGNSSTWTGNALFDGVGSVDVTVNLNFMGTLLPAGTLTAAYTVTGDGTSLLSAGFGQLEGGVAEGGEMALWGGGMSAGESPAVAVVLKEATSAGLATFQGDYWCIALARDPGTSAFRSFHGTATADGVGNVTLSTTANTEGTIAVEPPLSTTYSVAANGKFTVDTGGGPLQGGISQDGKYAVLGGGTEAGSDPTLCLLCRK